MQKKTLENTVADTLAKNVPDTLQFINDIENLTVEDVVVVYAYAEAIVETVREPLVILDSDLRIKTANKSFFDAFKVTKKDTYNKLIFDLGNGQWNIQALKRLLKEILPKNSFFEGFEVTHEFDDIGSRTMVLNARRIILEGHKTELILLAIEDITEKKLIDRQKDDFVGIATHELKTPLTSIRAFTKVLQKHHARSKDDKSDYLLGKITDQIDRMEVMMSSLLNVYKAQTGTLNLHKTHFDMDELLNDIIETFQYTSGSHKIILKGKPVGKVYGDKEKISQVILNLITNAIKYSPGAEQVLVTKAKSARKMSISIQDFGLGISKEEQAMVFERFFRSQGKEEEEIQGLGLGLYISHEIIHIHKGELKVKSTKGRGSTFTFTLPLSSAGKS